MDFTLLAKQQYKTVDPDIFHMPKNDTLDWILEQFTSDIISYDFETTGLSAHLDDAVSVGLCDGNHTVSIYFKDPEQRTKVCHWLLTKKLVGYNFIFDGLFLAKYTGQVPWPYRDAMVMYKSLANEGHTGQTWTLKAAMVDVLGWPSQNDVELRQYMKYHKCDMHQVPWDMLCKYNALDALATWQMYEYLEAQAARFPGLVDFWNTEWQHLIALLIEQHWLGISVDVEHYKHHRVALAEAQSDLLDSFYQEIQQYLDEFNALAVAAIELAVPKRPYKMDGSPSQAMVKHQARVEAARSANHFNTDSNDHLCWLFYDRMGLPVARRTPSGKPSVAKATLSKFGTAGLLLMKYRKKRDENKLCNSLLKDVISDRIHCDIRVHGSISGRCSSGKELK